MLNSTVFLFPLPNALLYRKVTLPYHVFEEKYKEMVLEAIKTDTPVAVVPEGASQYEGMVCVSGIPHILGEHPDGSLDIYITGEHKCKLIKQAGAELPFLEYSFRELEENLELNESYDLEMESLRLLLQRWSEKYLNSEIQRQQFLITLNDPEILVNYCAFFLVDDYDTKHNLMRVNTLEEKVWLLIGALGPKEITLSPFLPPLRFK